MKGVKDNNKPDFKGNSPSLYMNFPSVLIFTTMRFSDAFDKNKCSSPLTKKNSRPTLMNYSKNKFSLTLPALHFVKTICLHGHGKIYTLGQ